jgi:hypothetical protein
MWKANTKTRELRHSSGVCLESLGNMRWLLKEGKAPQTDELRKGFICFFDCIANEGFRYINQKHGLNTAECVDRINFVINSQGTKSYEVNNTLKLKDGEAVISFNQSPRYVTEIDYIDWASNEEQVPYWVFMTMRAAFNNKYMRDYEFKTQQQSECD